MKRLSLPFILFLLFSISILSACGGPPAQSAAPDNSGPAASGDAAAGQKIFSSTCAACHGPAGEGVPGLGKDMTSSEFIAGKTDQELVDFIKVGRDPSDPLNSTGVAMPVKGGNPSLSDQDLYDIVAYIRTIHK
jgi:disulfide bond formation protein DsbB